MRLALPCLVSALVLGLCLPACTSKSATADGPAEPDLSVRASGDLAGSKDLSMAPGQDLSSAPGQDLSSAPDLSQPTSTPVHCGGTVDVPTPCTALMPICCSGDEGKTGTCVGMATSCAAGTIPYQCDRPADCQAGQVCCLTYTGSTPTGSACQPSTTTCPGKLLCTKTVDCSTGQTCCSFTPGAASFSYSYCTSNICPGAL